MIESSSLPLYEVAVTAPIPGTLTYSQPEGIVEPLPVGSKVLAPLGGRLITGYVLAQLPNQAEFTGNVKPLSECLECEPFFPASLIPFFRWVADYYHHPIGEVIRTALPAGLSSVSNSAAVRAKTETVVRLCAPPSDQSATKLKQSEQKTLDIFFQHCGGSLIMPRRELTRLYAGASKALHGLAEAGLIRLEERQVLRDPFGDTLPFFDRPEILTEEQTAALSAITAAMDAGQFQPFLLHGVTGCGKTEIYLRATEHCLAQRKNVLVLVPELALSTQIEAHFYSRFGDTMAVLHSGLSAGERFDQWQRIMRQKVTIAVGARSAVFAPFANLGLVIVDEEHEAAYKQDDGLRYNGRDMAVLRARFAACPVLLGSATPSVGSFYHAEQGKYRLLTLHKRIDGQSLPSVEIVDLGKTKRPRTDWFFSEQLLTALRDNVAQGLQSLLFVNRRGYASFMLCQDCSSVVRCRNCKVSLTLHRGSERLICHYCGYSVRPDILCPECGSGSLVGLGIGSERIEAEVKRLFPQARVARLDSDTAGNRRAYMALLQQVRELEIDILVGTQMVAKGLHFPRITLVGVVWADSGLGMPDYKAAERSFQLLAQVTGRAGRGEHPGRVIIQTHQPGHYVLEAARCHEYQAMYAQEIELRAQLGYPPFGRLINLRFSGEEEQEVEAAAKAAADFLRIAAAKDTTPVDILGPAPSPLSLIKNRFRWQVLLKSGQPEQLHRLCNQLITEKKQQICRKSVRMGIDVDPENMM
ncbi:MAG: replication restart DNA helicase PriA [Candidatus Electronema aureum]|uniref:Replication restart protein PriA n=1 Tax=Candidatus Electronema aureum TaxID=2005002 RepID=A0A521G491_9BACT|nr:MAG: replication restart DNA helicase PriA [Candidatus Electronema aureum]